MCDKSSEKIILVDGLILLFTFITSPICDVAQTSDGGILVFTFIVSPVCDVAQTSDGGIIIFTFIKALYVMSLRRPTVAFLLKPFMWCR